MWLVLKEGKRPRSKFDNDGMFLVSTWIKIYKNTDRYYILYRYTSNPMNLKVQGSAAITDAKGLYSLIQGRG